MDCSEEDIVSQVQRRKEQVYARPFETTHWGDSDMRN